MTLSHRTAAQPHSGPGDGLARQGGEFRVGLKNKNAAGLKLHPLNLAGLRMKTILPSKVEDGMAFFDVDTGKDGSCVFFELRAE
jgi:hypothetical protein